MKLKEAKYFKSKFKEDAIKMKKKLENKIEQLKCELKEKSKEHDKLLKKSSKQIKTSTLTRLKSWCETKDKGKGFVFLEAKLL